MLKDHSYERKKRTSRDHSERKPSLNRNLKASSPSKEKKTDL